jgi:hypothetical protein
MCCAEGKCEAELFGPNRIYDVAINDYSGKNHTPPQAEYRFSVDEYKYKHIHHAMSDVIANYKACALFDDDVRVSTKDLNRLFLVGDALQLNIWQAALTANSYSSWSHLYLKHNSCVRLTNTVEIMMPFFSRSALQTCWESFPINYSAWGLQVVWAALLNTEKIAIIDLIPVFHIRPITSFSKVMPNGKTPLEEAEIVFNQYNLRPPSDIY